MTPTKKKSPLVTGSILQEQARTPGRDTDRKIRNGKLLLSGHLEQTETKHKLTQADMKADRRRTSRHKQTKNKTDVMATQAQADRQADKADMAGHEQAESRAWPDTMSASRQSFPFRIF